MMVLVRIDIIKYRRRFWKICMKIGRDHFALPPKFDGFNAQKVIALDTWWITMGDNELKMKQISTFDFFSMNLKESVNRSSSFHVHRSLCAGCDESFRWIFNSAHYNNNYLSIRKTFAEHLTRFFVLYASRTAGMDFRRSDSIQGWQSFQLILFLLFIFA